MIMVASPAPHIPWNMSNIARVLFNQVFINTFMFHTFPLGTESDSWMRFILGLPFVMLVQEILFYFIHKFFHESSLYRYHKIHHRWTQTLPWSALDAHPLEHALANMVPVLAGPALLGWPQSWVRIWTILATINTVWVHQYRKDNDLHHTAHHKYQTGNYGSEWADKLFGTMISKS